MTQGIPTNLLALDNRLFTDHGLHAKLLPHNGGILVYKGDPQKGNIWPSMLEVWSFYLGHRASYEGPTDEAYAEPERPRPFGVVKPHIRKAFKKCGWHDVRYISPEQSLLTTRRVSALDADGDEWRGEFFYDPLTRDGMPLAEIIGAMEWERVKPA